MSQFIVGFAACAVLSVAFPRAGVVINQIATRLITWAVGLARGKSK